MNEFWSDHVQGVMTLYLSRKLRFDDQFFEQYRQLFALDENADLQVLEIGCGQGADVIRIFAETGWREGRVEQDLSGRDRVFSALKP